MTHGPCGGVEPDGTCELGDRRCTFVDGGLVTWAGPPAPQARPPDPLFDLIDVRPIVVADLPERSLDSDSVRRAASALAGHADAVLFGDAGWARVQLPPSYRAGLVAREGIRAWAGLNCRDRNRVALEGELAALAELGALVHCVTGDHTQLGNRPDAQPVFDLDGLQLAALANAMGLVVSVGENPVAPPYELRPARAAEKARAGAHVCFVNHAGSADRVRDLRRGDTGRRARPTWCSWPVCPWWPAGPAWTSSRRSPVSCCPRASWRRSTGRPTRSPRVSPRRSRSPRRCWTVPGVAGVDLSAAFPPGTEEVATRAAVAVARELRG